MAAEEPTQVKLDPSKMSIHADDALMPGKYSNLINASLSSHDCMLDFVFVDATTAQTKNPTGYLQARILLSHSNIEPLIKLLQQQIEFIKSEQKTAE
ncbi:MAG: DUF3467 domain-containing protein [Actinomycetota bacterium]|jgi:hypothetical protein|nr:DUF3467 domain-containing protein [Actinomycetota bacterium]